MRSAGASRRYIVELRRIFYPYSGTFLMTQDDRFKFSVAQTGLDHTYTITVRTKCELRGAKLSRKTSLAQFQC
jgi:hypothetical protein